MRRAVQMGIGSLAILGALLSGIVASYAAPSISQTGKTTKVQCYEFNLANDQKGRRVTDVHFGLSKQVPSNFQAPPDWGWSVSPTGVLTFQTPPAAPAPGATVTRNPIDPGKSLSGFRFCLPTLDPNVTISISYDRGPASAAAAFQGKNLGDTIVHTAALYCTTLRVRAPAEQDVWDIHLSKDKDAISDPGIDRVSAPKGWSVDVGPKEATLQAGKDADPIKAGTTVDLDICTKLGSPRLAWKFTDKDHKDIAGASGTAQTFAP